LGVELRVSPPTVNDIVREKRGMTAEMAARLAKYFGTSEQFRLNLRDASAVHQVKEKLPKELRGHQALCRSRGAIASLDRRHGCDGGRYQGVTRRVSEGVQSGSRRNQNPVE
jgi:plasmid maintenance system antidote protein VapI